MDRRGVRPWPDPGPVTRTACPEVQLPSLADLRVTVFAYPDELTGSPAKQAAERGGHFSLRAVTELRRQSCPPRGAAQPKCTPS
jgi:hypothetical protein